MQMCSHLPRFSNRNIKLFSDLFIMILVSINLYPILMFAWFKSIFDF